MTVLQGASPLLARLVSMVRYSSTPAQGSQVGGVTLVEHLPDMCKVLDSSPISENKKKKPTRVKGWTLQQALSPSMNTAKTGIISPVASLQESFSLLSSLKFDFPVPSHLFFTFPRNVRLGMDKVPSIRGTTVRIRGWAPQGKMASLLFCAVSCDH